MNTTGPENWASSVAAAARFIRTAMSHSSWGLAAIAALLAVMRSSSIIVSALLANSLTIDHWWRLVSSLVAGACLLIAVLLAEEGARCGAKRVVVYTWAMLGAAVMTVCLHASVVEMSCTLDFLCPIRWSQPHPWMWLVFIATDVVMKGGLVAFLYINSQLMLNSMHGLREAEIERFAAEQNIAESRLTAMNAHIDPQRTIDALRRVALLGDKQRHVADRILDSLTDELRTATAAARI